MFSVLRNAGQGRVSLRHYSRSDDSRFASDLRAGVISHAPYGRRCCKCHLSFGDGNHFEVTHHNGDHSDMSIENTAPVCELCHQVEHIDLIWKKWPSESGKIIFLPEIDQFMLNAMFTAIVVKKTLTPGHEAELLIEKLKARQMMIPEPLSKLRDVFSLSIFLRKLNDDDYANRGSLLNGLRWLPAEHMVKPLVPDWTSKGAAFSGLHPDNWGGLFDTAKNMVI